MKTFRTKGICALEIQLDIEDGIIHDVRFIGGCSGNALGISSLVKGLKADDAVSRLKGIDCKGRGTSCPDQLAKAIETYIQE